MPCSAGLPGLQPSDQFRLPRIQGRGGRKSHAPTELREDPLHHVPLHVRQPEVAAGVAVGQLLVVQPEQVQHRGVQVVDVDLVLDGVVARSRRSCRRRGRP